MHFDLYLLRRKLSFAVLADLRMEMRSSGPVACLLLLQLLCPLELSSSLHWPGLRGAPRLAERRLVAVSKTSREALHFGRLWTVWQRTHEKTYLSSMEALERYVVWRSNTAYIQYHNNYADKFGFTMAMNSFGDLVSIIIVVCQ